MTHTIKPNPATKRPRKMAREPNADEATAPSDVALPPAAEPAPAKPQSKAGLVLNMLKRTEGATIEQLVDATGWLPHTTRAALTGLKKKGHAVTSEKPAKGARLYRVAP